MSEFKVSVIIPVYNAEKYLNKAVDSALGLNEVHEIIIVEDKSPDNALKIALNLEQQHPKVCVFQHPDKQNHGAGASRNLGIMKAKCDYIAFLDADDYYLPNRFKRDQEIFSSNSEVDGVYGAIGIYYYSEAAKNQFLSSGYGYQEFLTLSDYVSNEDLFKVLFHSHQQVKGEFSTIAITVKKTVFKKVGYFNTALRLGQDVHMWKRMAAFCHLEAGELKKPVAIRGVHGDNRMTQKKEQEKYKDLWWKSLKNEFKIKKLNKDQLEIFEQAYYNYFSNNSNKLVAVAAWLMNTFKKPNIIKESNGDFDFNFWKVFGKNWFTLHLISFKNKLFK